MKTKTMKSLFFAILFLQGLFVYSQTFYETKFKDLRGNTYLGFMVYYSESNCYMRIAFTQSNVYSVVNVEYESITGIEDGINYMYLIGKNPTFITGNLYESYNPEHFIWIWNEFETTEKPFYTTDPEFNLENIYLVEYFNTLDISQLSETYLHQFYTSNEPDYLSFLAAINNENVFDASDFQSPGEVTLHLFVVANTMIGDIGQSCSVDKRNIISEFDGIAEALTIPIRKYIVDENKFTKPELINKMNEITTSSNDVIVFLYTGHGFRWNDQEDYYPQLDLRANNYQQLSAETSISASEIYNTLSQKGARVTLVLFDCCNSNSGLNQVTNSSFLATRSNKNFNYTNLSKLILESSGSGIASAASPNEYSWSNNTNGGFFTSSFLEAFRQEISVLSNNPDWNNLLSNSMIYAKNKTSPNSCPNCQVQNGIKYVKITQN